MSELRIVEVIWVDACALAGTADQHDWPAPVEIHSVGYLLRQDPQQILLGRDACPEEATHRALLAIPARCVLTIDDLVYQPGVKESSAPPAPDDDPLRTASRVLQDLLARGPLDEAATLGVKIETFGAKPTVTLDKPQAKRIDHTWSRSWVFDNDGPGPWYHCTRCQAATPHPDMRPCPGDPQGPPSPCLMCGVRCWEEVHSDHPDHRHFRCVSCDHLFVTARTTEDPSRVALADRFPLPGVINALPLIQYHSEPVVTTDDTRCAPTPKKVTKPQ